jgi:hypothetical protein
MHSLHCHTPMHGCTLSTATLHPCALATASPWQVSCACTAVPQAHACGRCMGCCAGGGCNAQCACAAKGHWHAHQPHGRVRACMRTGACQHSALQTARTSAHACMHTHADAQRAADGQHDSHCSPSGQSLIRTLGLGRCSPATGTWHTASATSRCPHGVRWAAKPLGAELLGFSVRRFQD